MTTDPQTAADFDGCNRKCRLAGAHTLVWGECEHAVQPEPTVSLSRVYTDADGFPSVGFDTYTVQRLGELITAGVRASDLPVNGDDLVDVGLVAAHAIFNRNTAAPAAAVPVAAPPTTEQTALRERVAEALLDHLSRTADIRPGRDGDLAFMPEVTDAERMRLADAVLAVLPAPADRAAVLREAADDLATAFGDPMAKHIGVLGASHLRRRARQIEAGQTGEDQPETPLEKRLRYSERRNDELRAESLRRGKVNLEYAEKIVALEREIDEVRRQLGAEILRAGQAEDELRRLAAEAPHAEAPDDDPLRMAEELCPGFPDRCPNLRTVEPEPGVHLGGVRCGCADAAPAVVAQAGKETQT
ncbi:coiled-coil domain-containing protein [Streptomyces europaeiscabiei]|uniref:Uncharacterized protein n=1 Tax=Streptomyces europaeiscabiei TaxID=146819 RepID=A0ABU4NW58_9ACTN|nr:hypothetical protein [Streptomyces europaeiscabiei]MDX2528012.1 hypothetical protein [Streptomyces europaeiscabiei]MDX3550131.1 hypothetical protein [Streptomyces europaeiscabiei]MDX3558811.1 hypothetical protein [Streptomyces europaeiscabiei]MDX3707253.1 hypothetical protein [Streptomyces europaeiscabiei]